MTQHTRSEQRTSSAEEMRTSYGYRQVEGDEKQPMVDSVFHRVAGRYDVMNDLMSAGMHRLWKDAMVARLSLPRRVDRPWHGIDVAGGTGDIAMRIARAGSAGTRVSVVDINASMLEVGRERARAARLDDRLDFIEANAEELPFEANCFDAYTIAFGIRNVPRIDTALSEAFRVLKPGGQFVCLEFSRVDMPGLDRFYEQWSLNVIPRIGQIVAGDGEPYRYLVESIRKFPDQHSFAGMIRKAGFARVGFTNMTGGIVALHWGWKL